MTCSHRLAVVVILLVAGAQAAADRVKGVSEKEGKKIVAIFAEHPKLLSVMRRVIAAIDKKNKKVNGKRGLLQSEDELCASFEGEVACDEMTATNNPPGGGGARPSTTRSAPATATAPAATTPSTCGATAPPGPATPRRTARARPSATRAAAAPAASASPWTSEPADERGQYCMRSPKISSHDFRQAKTSFQSRPPTTKGSPRSFFPDSLWS